MTDAKSRGPGVNFPPPLLFVTGFVAGWLLERNAFDLLPPLSPGTQNILTMSGIFLVAFGLSTSFIGLATFRRARTAIFPNREASQLVTSGPYRRTRNPMYAGLMLAYVGFALGLSVGWALLLLPVVLLALYQFVIAREEQYLTDAFGDQYRQYQQKVGRWF